MIEARPQFKNEITQRLADFVSGVGIPLLTGTIAGETFLPGIEVRRGGILIDEARLKYPGDILHEAGHLAMAPAALRANLSGEVDLPGFNADVIETYAIAWSYAAIVFLQLDPKILFHADGYLGRSESLRLNYEMGVYLGSNGLENAGMTLSGSKATAAGVPPYPHMLKWLKD